MCIKIKKQSLYRGRYLYFIQDWAGNTMNFGRFFSYDSAEEFLSERLGDAYDTNRGEYTIMCENGCPF